MSITKDLLHELFDYKDGQLIRKVNSGTAKIGDIAGCFSRHLGYVLVSANGKQYRLHRLIYIYHYGDIPDKLQIDHINGNRIDNRIDNLRLVTNQENGFNRLTAKGYRWIEKAKKFQARIVLNGKDINLGLFTNENDAREAYLNAKANLHTIENRL